jgi:small subunit ribosomal protein S4
MVPTSRPPRSGAARRAAAVNARPDLRRLGELYDLSDAQLKTYARKAARLPGRAQSNLPRLLERRLDHVVFRLGFADTIGEARQLIRHGHIVVDGRRLSISSFLVAPGQRIEVHPASRDRDKIRASVAQGPRLPLPRFLERAPDGWAGAVRA